MSHKEQYKQLQISLLKTVVNWLETTKDDWVENLLKSKTNKKTGVLKYKDLGLSDPKSDILQIIISALYHNMFQVSDEKKFEKKVNLLLSSGDNEWHLWIFDSIYNYLRLTKKSENPKEEYIKYLGYLKENIDSLYKKDKEDKVFKKKTETFYKMIEQRLNNPKEFLKFRN